MLDAVLSGKPHPAPRIPGIKPEKMAKERRKKRENGQNLAKFGLCLAVSAATVGLGAGGGDKKPDDYADTLDCIRPVPRAVCWATIIIHQLIPQFNFNQN